MRLHYLRVATRFCSRLERPPDARHLRATSRCRMARSQPLRRTTAASRGVRRKLRARSTWDSGPSTSRASERSTEHEVRGQQHHGRNDELRYRDLRPHDIVDEVAHANREDEVERGRLLQAPLARTSEQHQQKEVGDDTANGESIELQHNAAYARIALAQRPRARGGALESRTLLQVDIPLSGRLRIDIGLRHRFGPGTANHAN
jgi:hypothetical protein